MTHVMAPDERRRRLASGPDLHVSERYDGAQPRSDLNVKNILTYLPTYSLSSRITFKLACLTYKLLTIGQPAYLRMLLHHYTSTHTTLSTNQFFLYMPQFSTEFGKRSFSYLTSTVWNGLPLNIRLSPTFDNFKLTHCCA